MKREPFIGALYPFYRKAGTCFGVIGLVPGVHPIILLIFAVLIEPEEVSSGFVEVTE